MNLSPCVHVIPRDFKQWHLGGSEPQTSRFPPSFTLRVLCIPIAPAVNSLHLPLTITMPTTAKKSNAKATPKTSGTAHKSRVSTHPSWIDMIKECITAHPDEARMGVSRPMIKKFVESKYGVNLDPAAASQLNRAITSGSEKGIFVLPKGPSGKIKLAPKARTDAAKENAKPVSRKPVSTKATATKAKAAPTKPVPVRKVPAVRTPTKAKAATATKTKRATAKPAATTVARPVKKAPSTTAKTATAKKPAATVKKATTAKKGAAKKAVTGEAKKPARKPKAATTAKGRAAVSTKPQPTSKAKPASKAKPVSKTAVAKKPASKKA
ncbi:hypothetical protein FPV67DRAFT_1509297 [Lyophyllum atratum]|nr:hypothetical protein FPV67DRAFT_1509297 [Lyophyllum atratum]